MFLVLTEFVLRVNAGSTTVEGGSNHQIFEPVIVITKAIKVFKGTEDSCLKGSSLATIGMKVPKQSQRTNRKLRRLSSTVKILHCVE
jgi:hypothetical protein